MKSNRFRPSSKFKFFLLQCFSPIAKKFVDHLKPECKNFDDAHERASKMNGTQARVGMSEDGKNWVFPKGLVYQPQEQFEELA